MRLNCFRNIPRPVITPAVIRPPQPPIKLLILMIINVGIGSVPPIEANMDEKVGTTNIIITAIARTAMTVTIIGYVIAPLTFFFNAIAFSIYAASLLRIVSRIPPASPAATMFAYNSVNTLGCFLRASA